MSRISTNKKVLIFDPDKTFQQQVLTYLKKYFVIEMATMANLFKLLNKKNFNIVILNVKSESDLKFLRKIYKINLPQKYIVLSSSLPKFYKDELLFLGVKCILEYPFTKEELKECIDNIMSDGGMVTGRVTIDLVTLLQVFSYEKKTSLIYISSGSYEGKIYIEHGILKETVLGDLKGMNAFIKILSFNSYIYYEIPYESIEGSINMEIEHALMKAMKAIDEKKIKKEEKMAKSEDLVKLQKQLSEEIPGFVACSIVSLEEGLPLAGESANPNTDIGVPSGAFAESFKSVAKAYEYSKWGNINEVILEGKNVTIILFSLKDGKYYQGLGAKSSTSIGMLKAVFSKYKDKIESLL